MSPSTKRSRATTTVSETVPAAVGYRMPAEWEPHSATWLAWPHYEGDWPGKFEPIPWVYAEIIRNIAKHESVELIVNNRAAAEKARRILERADAFSANIRFHHWPTCVMAASWSVISASSRKICQSFCRSRTQSF